MRDDPDHRISLQPVGGRRSRLGGWLAVGAVAALLVGIVVAGRFGGRASDPARVAASEPGLAAAPSGLTANGGTGTNAPTATGGTGTNAPSATGPKASGGISPTATAEASLTCGAAVATPEPVLDAGVFSAPSMGFLIARATPVPERIVEHEDRGAVELLFPQTNLPPTPGSGTIEVAVGTIQRGADIHAPDGRRVYAGTLGELEGAFRASVPGAGPGASETTMGGWPALELDVPGGPEGIGGHATTVVLAVQAGRAYVITASGFHAGDAAATNAAQHRALRGLAGRIQFLGGPSSVSGCAGFGQ